ncbi:MAG TPA: Sua5/YciO/YrdC/YwlC family protein, partial [bacterium]|nr:Sua5/YciO/YrdC/YwlC family protein [bacterium]
MAIEQIVINGIVQGIGFRPAVYELATRLGLSGCVYNDARGVIVEVAGEQQLLDTFAKEITAFQLNKMKIEQFERKPLVAFSPQAGSTDISASASGFRILATQVATAAVTFMPPDLAVCESCKADMQNTKDTRRHGYFLTACTQCGPRFTVIEKMPYRREDTVMQAFPLCKDCLREYEQPTTRRFNFETNTCRTCGPKLRFAEIIAGKPRITKTSDPIDLTRKYLADGKIIAIKGVGGFHIAVDACSEEAVERLRVLKKRPHKPFAVMFPDIATLRSYAYVSA